MNAPYQPPLTVFDHPAFAEPDDWHTRRRLRETRDLTAEAEIVEWLKSHSSPADLLAKLLIEFLDDKDLGPVIQAVMDVDQYVSGVWGWGGAYGSEDDPYLSLKRLRDTALAAVDAKNADQEWIA
jgi:hypothetical protein